MKIILSKPQPQFLSSEHLLFAFLNAFSEPRSLKGNMPQTSEGQSRCSYACSVYCA